MSVFISHSSKDKPAVVALAMAMALRERGIDVWLDKWEIGAGDEIVARINAGLDEAGCGILRAVAGKSTQPFTPLCA